MSKPHELLPVFTHEHALELLEIHSFYYEDLDDPRMETSFLHSLRPYRGRLPQEAFQELMGCLRTLGPTFCDRDVIDRRMICQWWSICHYARSWVLDPHSVVQQEKLITEADSQTLALWLDCLADAVTMFLERPDPSEAFQTYDAMTLEQSASEPE